MLISSAADVTTTDIRLTAAPNGTDYANRSVISTRTTLKASTFSKDRQLRPFYGIRASNGVIIITTKSGKGLAKGKPDKSVPQQCQFDDVGRHCPNCKTTYAQRSGARPLSGHSWGPKICRPRQRSYIRRQHRQRIHPENGKTSGIILRAPTCLSRS